VKRVVGIDADLITYAAGFVVQKKIDEGKSQNINDAQKVIDTIVRKVLRKSESTHYLGYLTDSKSNFRLTRATTLPYKGNRAKAKATKPLPFKEEMIKYMIVHWGFQLVKGVEADDALTIAGEYFRGREEQYILATKDKDLWQWEGSHYNMNNDTLMTIGTEEANRNLWKQVLIGDMGTDYIPGLSHAAKYEQSYYSDTNRRPLAEFLLGDKGALKLLDEWCPEDYCVNIMDLYMWHYGQWGDEEDDSFGISRFHETFDLVYMLLEEPEGVSIKTTYRKCTEKDLEEPYGFLHTKPTAEGFKVLGNSTSF